MVTQFRTGFGSARRSPGALWLVLLCEGPTMRSRWILRAVRSGSALRCPTSLILLRNVYVWALPKHMDQTRKEQMTGRKKERERDEESEPGGRGQTEKTGMQRQRADTHVWLCEKMPSVSELEENYHHGNDLPDTSTLTSAVILERSVRDGCGGACLVPRRLVSTQLELPIHTHARTHTRTHLHSQPCASAFAGNFINVGPISSLIPYQLFYLFI